MSNNIRKENLLDIFLRYAVQIVLVALTIYFALNSSIFLSFDNILNVLRQVAVPGIIAIGMAFIIITGGTDLSVGSVVALCGIIAGTLMKQGMNMYLVILITLFLGISIGAFNGVFVNEFGLPPFIATLGTMTLIRGITYVITQGTPVYDFSKEFKFIGQGYLGPIPFPVIIMAIIYVFGYIFIEQTKYGRYIYGIGGNEEAAKLSGISVKRIKYMVYMINGGLTAVAGIVLLSRLNTGQPVAGTGMELDVITAVALGGISISGGEGKISGVLVGVLILGVLTNRLQLMNVNVYIQKVIQGLVLLAAVSFDRLMHKRNANAV
jgi:ribose transport system permease protein